MTTINKTGIGFGFWRRGAWTITCPTCTSMRKRNQADAVLLDGNGDIVICDKCGGEIK